MWTRTSRVVSGKTSTETFFFVPPEDGVSTSLPFDDTAPAVASSHHEDREERHLPLVRQGCRGSGAVPCRHVPGQRGPRGPRSSGSRSSDSPGHCRRTRDICETRVAVWPLASHPSPRTNQGESSLPYRTTASLPTEILEIRPEPVVARYLTLFAALVTTGPGAVEIWLAATHGGPIDVLGAAVQVVVGLVMLRAFRRSPTRIRFTYDASDVRITWLRGSREMRTERLARSDLVDVGIDDTPSSGGSCYRLVLGTRLGDLVFTDGYTSGIGHYEGAANEIHRALDIPVR